MKRFGFYALPPLETPADERAPSGIYKGTKLFDPAKDSDVDPGRLAFGQERLLVTPLQMAMVAATIANDGVVMKPQVDRPDRRARRLGRSCARSRSGSTARSSPRPRSAVAAMMKDVVEEGTGTAARIDGITVAGKTGTAETGIAGLNTTWFIGFAGKDRPQVAIAVVVEQQNSTGGADRRARRQGGLAGASAGQRRTPNLYSLWPPATTSSTRLFDGRYLIIRKLGSGGMANVYLA